MRPSRNYSEKLKHVLPAFSLVLWGSVILLGLFRWIFFIGKYPLLELDEDILNYWIPVSVSWIPVLLWLKPKFKPIVFKIDHFNGSWRLQLVAWISISASLIFSQYYLTTTTGKLLELKNVREISQHERVRYYRIKEFAVYPYIGGVKYAFRVTGRYNENLDIDIYFVNPILTHKTQHIITTPLYWYGVTFNKRISNWGSNARKEARFKAFFEKCIAEMRHYDFHKPDHFEHKPASYDRENFRKAIQYAIKKPVNNDFVILQPVNEAYESRNGYKTAWIFASYIIGIILYMLVLISPDWKKEPEESPDEDAVMNASNMD